MDIPAAMTIYASLKRCRSVTAEVLDRMAPVAHTVKQQAETSGLPVHEVHLLDHKGMKVIYAVYHSRPWQQQMVYLLSEDNDHMEAFAYEPKKWQFHHYNSHFFHRYAQRFSLTHMAPCKVAVHYFSHNPLTVFSRYRKVKNKRQELFAIVNHGVLLGYIDLEHRIVNFGTIISNRSLNKRKRKRSYPCRHVLHELKENK